MKLKKYVFLLVAVLSVSAMVACSPREVEQKLDDAENSVERNLDKAEDKIENTLMPNTNSSASDKSEISSKQAEETALKHAKFAAEDVSGLHSEYESDDKFPHYDVNFYVGNMEYEYKIHAKTGDVLAFEMDD